VVVVVVVCGGVGGWAVGWGGGGGGIRAHLQMFPSKRSSTSARDSGPESGRDALSRSSEYIAMTCPGVQNPHCVPLHAAMRSCTGWRPFFEEPIPSVVVMAAPSHNKIGRMHALTLENDGLPPLNVVIITLHAPQPPCVHESCSIGRACECATRRKWHTREFFVERR